MTRRAIIRITALLAFALGALSASAAGPDILIADFDGTNYANWQVEGNAFGTAPATGTLLDQKAVTGFIGKGFASSCFKGDKGTGKLVSSEFKIQRDYIQFLIGGGDRFPTQTCLNLVVDGKILHTATGKPGSETLKFQQWDMRELKGRTGHLEVIDATTAPRGHIMVDNILQTDIGLVTPSYELKITKPFLQVPVKNGARKTAFEIFAGTNLVRTFETELATENNPDWWASDDITALHGQILTVRCKDQLPPALTNNLSELFQQTDQSSMSSVPDYEEAMRPQFHFTVRRGWNNDPNGLAYFNGEWHMFFQKIPYGMAVGDFRYMHWGHAVSPDLFHWTELPPAIYPITSGIFSGGAFVDHGNKSGLGEGTADLLIASYTGAGECIATGTGRALELKNLPANPVLKHKGRDPQIFRYEPGNKWVMVVYEEAQQTGYAFYESQDLKSWRRMFCIEGGHECPNFFEMPVEGESTRKWVLYGAVRRPAGDGSSEMRFTRSAYMVGTFDGNKFVPETEFLKGFTGPNFYAAQTFANAPNDRRILVAWLQGGLYPGMPFTQGITLPTELKLRRAAEGLRLFFNPVKELDQLRTQTFEGKNLNTADANSLFKKAKGELLDAELTLDAGNNTSINLRVRGNTITWNPSSGQLSCRGTTVKLPLAKNLNLRIIIDRCVLEIYPEHGITGLTFGGNIFSNKEPLKLASEKPVQVESLRISELKSAWNP